MAVALSDITGVASSPSPRRKSAKVSPFSQDTKQQNHPKPKRHKKPGPKLCVLKFKLFNSLLLAIHARFSTELPCFNP